MHLHPFDRRRRATLLAGLGGLSLALTGCGGASQGDPAGSAGGLESMKPVTLSLQTWLPQGADDANIMDAFAQEVERASGGKIAFDIYYAGALLDPTENFQALADGRLDVAKVFTPYNPKELPIANAYARLGTAGSTSYPHGALATVAAEAESFFTDEDLRNEFESQGVKPLFAGDALMPFDLLCTEDIDDIDDLKGRRVRAPGTVFGEQAKALGMTPVTIATSEVYEALQRGVLDCSIQRTATLDQRDLWDVAKYVVPNVFAASPGGSVWAMSAAKFESLPEAAQKVVLDAGRSLLDADLKESLGADRMTAEQADSKGLIVVDPAPVHEALKAFNEELTDSVSEQLPDSVADPEAWVDQRLELNAKWLSVLEEDLGPAEPADPSEFWDRIASVEASDLESYADKVAATLWP